MTLALVFDKERPDTIGVYFERACQALGLAYDHWWTRDAKKIPATYDWYLRIDHGDYRDDVPSRLQPKVFYPVDTHLPRSWQAIRRQAQGYDLVCCAQRRGAERIPGAAWVPLACDAELHGRKDLPTRWDIASVGTEGGIPRKFYLQALRERYAATRLLEGAYTEIGAVYSQAKIGFNYSIRDDVNMRMFEVLCAGALLVTNRLSHDDLARLGFREREHYVAYAGASDVVATIDYYLAHDEERERIAAAGRAQALAAHTYVHRLQRIVELVHDRLGVTQEVLTP